MLSNPPHSGKSKIFTDTRSSSDTPIPIENAFGDRYGYCLAWVHWLACSFAVPCKTRIYVMTFITSPWLKLSAICTTIALLLAHNWWKSHNLHWFWPPSYDSFLEPLPMSTHLTCGFCEMHFSHHNYLSFYQSLWNLWNNYSIQQIKMMHLRLTSLLTYFWLMCRCYMKAAIILANC